VFVSTLEDIDTEAHRLQTNGYDAYMACASFTKQERKQESVSWVRSLWLDIDCGADKAEAGKGYATQQAGLVALRDFCRTTGLPKPTIVNSGRGLHAYWMMGTPVGAERWKRAAARLKQLCAEHALLADPVVTKDSARILRLPDTLNFKDPEAPLPVVVLTAGAATDPDRLEAILGVAAAPAVVAPVLRVPPKAQALALRDPTTLALMENHVSRFSLLVRKSIRGAGCAQIKHIVENQNNLEEPLWRAGLAVAWACIDKDTAIHLMSKGYEGYSYEGTVSKAAATTGPYRCDTFRELNAAQCEGCTQKVVSPIMLGREVLAHTPVEVAPIVHTALFQPLLMGEAYTPSDTYAELLEDNIVDLAPSEESDAEGGEAEAPEVGYECLTSYAPPFPYFRGANGGLYRKSSHEDEPDALLYEYDLYLSRLIEDPVDGLCAEINLHTPVHGHRTFVTPCTAIAAPDKFRDVMSRNGVVVGVKEMANIMKYNIDYVKELQRRGRKPDQARLQFGWADKDTKFIIGNREVGAKKTVHCPASSATANIIPYYEPRGTLAEWKKSFNMLIGDEHSAQAFVLMSTFGSPLLKYTGVKGAMVSLVNNKSGTGKTTILKLINSAWSHPEDTMLQKEDTYMSKQNRFGLLQNICVTIDEITNMKAEELSDMVYSASLGRGRNRMEASANKERLNHTRWASIAVVTGNSHVQDKLASLKAAPDGELMRLIEIELELANNDNADALLATLNENYGLAGEVFIGHVIANNAAVIDSIARIKARLVKDVGASRKERFWVGVAAANIAGGIIAQQLGLHDYNMRAIYAWTVRFFGEMRESAVSHVVDNVHVLGEFINEHLGAYLVIDGTRINHITGTHVIKPAHNKVLARLENDTRMLYITKKDFKAYCVVRQVSVENALKTASADYTFLATVKKRMAAGTGVISPAVDVYHFLVTGSVGDAL
jgi:hypothetical protein